ncbi:MAG: DUF547 domain-containing protein [Planctomycetota bacterium]|nr:DUF547 domain-containing protein [Planctomycetota bacterium]
MQVLPPNVWIPALALIACSGRAQESPSVVAKTPSAPPATVAEFDHQHTAWTQILRAHVTDDTFDYAALKKNTSQLKAYLRELRAVTPEKLKGWTKEQRFAFWINVYNAHTINKVVDNYPLDSIKDLSTGLFGVNSVFDKEFIEMTPHHPDGKDDELSLNDIEHGILRAKFKDARVHAAINCASFSCPPLRNEAFVADRLDKQLDEQMRAFVVDTKRNRFDRQENRLYLSEIFDWFKDDFERDAGTVKEFVARFAPEKDRELIRGAKVKHIDYDWDLNDVPKKGRG